MQREDDTEAVIRRRLKEFDRSCAPLVDFYSRAEYHRHHRINGDRDTDVVAAELLEIAGLAEARAAACGGSEPHPFRNALIGRTEALIHRR